MLRNPVCQIPSIFDAIDTKSSPMNRGIPVTSKSMSHLPPSFRTDCRYDEKALHLLALEGTVPIGTARLVYPPASDKFKLGRLAVRKRGRGKGIAQKLILGLEVAAKELGAKEIYAGSQVPVRPLYEKCGYHVMGDEYLDEGQPHMAMLKRFHQCE
jgi:predicted GNAT family N-acyltransferase